MSAKYFLDTNIFVYSFDRNESIKADISLGLIRQAIATGAGVVSYQVVQEFFNVAIRRFTQPMTTWDAEQYLSTIFKPLLAVHSSQSLYAKALRLRDQYRLSWYDSLIVSAAIEAECGLLYSEDLQHGQKFGGVQIRNPFLDKPLQ